VKAGTFTFTFLGGRSGTGTLVGSAWHWTKETMTFESAGFTNNIVSVRDDKHVRVEGTIEKSGKAIGTMVGTYDAFDCAALTSKRAGL
jgi:hypothetical protein